MNRALIGVDIGNEPCLKLARNNEGKFISLSRKRCGNIILPAITGKKEEKDKDRDSKTAPVKTAPKLVSRSTNPSLSKEETEVKVEEFKRKVGHKEVKLKNVRGEEVLVKYKFFSNRVSCPFISWEDTLPQVPLRLEISVGRAKVHVDLPTEYMERLYSNNGVREKAEFRRASDLRGYNDTYIPNTWSCNDICFYLRCEILGPIVDDEDVVVTIQEEVRGEDGVVRLEEKDIDLDVKKAIVNKHQLLNKERFSKIGGHLFCVNDDDKKKLKSLMYVNQFIPIL